MQWWWWWCVKYATQLTCVTANDDDNTDSCGTESGVSWLATSGVWYYILVNEYDEDNTGTFALRFIGQPGENYVVLVELTKGERRPHCIRERVIA